MPIRASQSTEPESNAKAAAPAAFVDVRDLAFRYGDRKALDGISFSLERRRILGLLGPNGSGKTTLFRILCTLLQPQAGQVRLAGLDLVRDPAGVRRRMGVVFQTNSLDQELTVAENLACQGRLHGLRGARLKARIDELLQRFDLGERRNSRVRTLSGGMRRRTELAKGLLHRPQILLLDEPTAGLDPQIRQEFWEHLTGLRDTAGITILFTTHLMEEAEVCDRLVILDQGRVVTAGSPVELKERIGGDVIVLHSNDPNDLKARMEGRFQGPISVVNGAVRMEQHRGHELIRDLMEEFSGEIQAISLGKPTLEDVFIQETGREFQASAEAISR